MDRCLAAIVEHAQDTEDTHILFDLIFAGLEIGGIIHSGGYPVEEGRAFYDGILLEQVVQLIVGHSGADIKRIAVAAESGTGTKNAPAGESDRQQEYDEDK